MTGNTGLRNALLLRRGRFGGIHRRLPEILAGEELACGRHMVFREQLALYLEQVLRVTQVAHQVAGYLGDRVVLSGKIFSHALSTGSLASQAYSSTEPSYASTVALTELRM